MRISDSGGLIRRCTPGKMGKYPEKLKKESSTGTGLSNLSYIFSESRRDFKVECIEHPTLGRTKQSCRIGLWPKGNTHSRPRPCTGLGEIDNRLSSDTPAASIKPTPLHLAPSFLFYLPPNLIYLHASSPLPTSTVSICFPKVD